MGTLYSKEPNEQASFSDGILHYLKVLWHKANDTPQKDATCLLHVSYHFADDPEEDYSEYVTSTWNGTEWTEDHFPSEADVTVRQWLNIKDLNLE